MDTAKLDLGLDMNINTVMKNVSEYNDVYMDQATPNQQLKINS